MEKNEDFNQWIVAEIGGIRTIALKALIDLAVMANEHDVAARRASLFEDFFLRIKKTQNLVERDLEVRLKKHDLAVTPELKDRLDEGGVALKDLFGMMTELHDMNSGTHEESELIEKIKFFVSDTLAPAFARVVTQVFTLQNRIASDALVKEREVIFGALGKIQSLNKMVSLVATNASIEAARAGTGGAGFRVIASSIQELSNETNEVVAALTRQIKPS